MIDLSDLFENVKHNYLEFAINVKKHEFIANELNPNELISFLKFCDSLIIRISQNMIKFYFKECKHLIPMKFLQELTQLNNENPTIQYLVLAAKK